MFGLLRRDPGAAQARAFAKQRRAAEDGDRDAAYALGLAYLRGKGVLPSLPVAARWLTQAAEQGHGDAQHQLSWALMQGENLDSAPHRWFAAAQAADSVAAERNRALLFPDGLGLPRDAVAAVRWARTAAEAGHGEAQAQLGYFLAQGLGCDRSPADARQWYERAAKRGIARGELGLGAMLLHGIGGPRDGRSASARTVAVRRGYAVEPGGRGKPAACRR